MQKKIIALAVAAAFSTPAFADVGFYGIVDASVGYVTAKNQKSALSASSGAQSTSRLGVKATEDIGSGMTAIAIVEYGIDTEDSATTLTARQKMLAVNADFGTVATGYLQTAAYDFLAKYDPIFGSSSSTQTIVGSGHLVGPTGQRAQRALAYISPNISGMVFAANYVVALTGNGAVGQPDVTGTTAATTFNSFKPDSALMLSANYAVDALSVGAVYATMDSGVNANGSGNAATAAGAGAGTFANLKTTEYAFGGSYDVGVAKIFGTYQSQKTDAANAKADSLFSLAGVYPVPTGFVGVLYASGKKSDSTSLGATALTAGYVHNFTKQTNGYVLFSNVKNGSGTHAYSVSGNKLADVAGAWGAAAANSVNNGASSSIIGIGLRKKF